MLLSVKIPDDEQLINLGRCESLRVAVKPHRAIEVIHDSAMGEIRIVTTDGRGNTECLASFLEQGSC